MSNKIKVIITRHAVERLFERRPTWYRKISGDIVANIIVNVIRSGKCLERKKRRDGDEEVSMRFSTNKYTICCTKVNDTLIVTTIMNTKQMTEEYRKALKLYSKDSPCKEVTFIVSNPAREIERWMREWVQEDMEKQVVPEQ
ncbi:MAG: DUF4258 domain-containing protein [Methanophagales archaeon]|nr:DUF4258 domain-containing protein [Methanophagales archaeon]MCW3141025.1 DUF4258 domain-containing protein [Methanophagales archaeon]